MLIFSIILNHEMHLLCFELTNIAASPTRPLLCAVSLLHALPGGGAGGPLETSFRAIWREPKIRSSHTQLQLVAGRH